jgi:hypothetical protein
MGFENTLRLNKSQYFQSNPCGSRHKHNPRLDTLNHSILYIPQDKEAVLQQD